MFLELLFCIYSVLKPEQHTIAAKTFLEINLTFLIGLLIFYFNILLQFTTDIQVYKYHRGLIY